jgi:hypothetical protein
MVTKASGEGIQQSPLVEVLVSENDPAYQMLSTFITFSTQDPAAIEHELMKVDLSADQSDAMETANSNPGDLASLVRFALSRQGFLKLGLSPIIDDKVDRSETVAQAIQKLRTKKSSRQEVSTEIRRQSLYILLGELSAQHSVDPTAPDILLVS